MKKKFLALVMTLSMVLSLVPMTALATEGESAAEPTQETQVKQQQQAEETGTQGEVKGQQTQNAGGNAGEVNTSSNVSAENVRVTMNNIFMRTNNTNCTIEYTVEPADYADRITFTYDKERISFTKNSDKNAFTIGARYDTPSNPFDEFTFVNKAGDTTEITAKYEGTEVGKCKIIFYSSLVSYALSTKDGQIGDEPSYNRQDLPFATPTKVYAVWDKEGVFRDKNPGVSWEWMSSDDSVVGITSGETIDNNGTANVTVYQQNTSGSRTNIYAKPTITINNEKYICPSIPTLAITCNGDAISCTSGEKVNPLVKEGDTVTFTLAMNDLDDTTDVTWKCNTPGLIDFSEQTGKSATVTINRGVLEEAKYVTINAELVVKGHVYKAARRNLYVRPNPINLDKQVSSFDDLKNAIEEGKKEIGVTGTITIPEGAELDLKQANLYRTSGNVNDAIFSVSTNASIKNGSVNGQYIGAQAPLIVVNENGKLSLENITLKNAKNLTGKGGAVSVENAALICDNVTFEKNSVSGDDKNKQGNNTFYGGGAIYATDSDVTIKNSKFTDSKATYANGGAIYLDQHSKGTIQNNTFTGCTAVAGPSYTDDANKTSDGAGGAIYCRIAGKVGIYDNKIIGCTAERGGGICVIASPESDITIDRNTIQNCKANYRGGGVSFINVPVAQKESEAVAYASFSKESHIQLLTGEISGCEAGIGGGIDYTGHGMEPLYLTNVIITGNIAVHATNDSHGGGIWACPWSKTTSYSTLGGAIYGNSADAGADVLYEGSDSEDEWALINGNKYDRTSSKMTLSSRALGGGKITWFDDYTNAGTTTPADSSLYTDTDKTFGVRGELSAENAQRAEAMANKLVIKNNKATSTLRPYGGGIATNSQIVIGLEGHDKSVTVTKSWSQETHPDSATVTLMQKDADNKSVALETVTLNKENGWTYTFKNLPGAYTASNGDVKDYTYSVSETAISGWTASIKEVDDKDNDANIAFEITNSPKRGGSSGGGPITIPDDVPTGLDLKNHYGYIIGYPVDYYTGKPTTDQTKKPVRPEGKITRAEVATIYFRMLTDENRAANWNQVSGFSDVKSSAWYNNAISTLTKAGILKGYEDGTFQPNGYITRAEFATIAIRFFSGVYEGEDLFPDIKGHWAEDYINNAANKGLVKGYEDGTFGPDRYITRAEAVTLVNRTLNRHPHNDGLHKDMLVWPDNMDTSKWYYADMQEATNSHEPDKNKSTADKEYWGKMLPIRDWEALEKEWSNANSAPGEGEVV